MSSPRTNTKIKSLNNELCRLRLTSRGCRCPRPRSPRTSRSRSPSSVPRTACVCDRQTRGGAAATGGLTGLRMMRFLPSITFCVCWHDSIPAQRKSQTIRQPFVLTPSLDSYSCNKHHNTTKDTHPQQACNSMSPQRGRPPPLPPSSYCRPSQCASRPQQRSRQL